MDTEPVIDVVCLVLFDADQRVLAARRPPHKRLGGLWEFPGGKIDPDELPDAALRRELREEMGLEVGELVAMGPVEHRYPFGTIRLWPYAAHCEGGKHPEIALHEHTAVRWVNAIEAAKLDWAPADLPVLRKIGF
jgi:8-oxo-dGTP diphosphatase